MFNGLHALECKRRLKQKGADFPLLSALGATRTHDPLVRNQVLYPLSYEGKSNPIAVRSIPQDSEAAMPDTTQYNRITKAEREGFEPSVELSPTLT